MSALARELGVSRQSLEGWKTKNKIPVERIVSYCLKKDLNIKYILTGAVENEPGEGSLYYIGEYAETDNSKKDIDMSLFFNDPIATIARIGGDKARQRAMGALLEIYADVIKEKQKDR